MVADAQDVVMVALDVANGRVVLLHNGQSVGVIVGSDQQVKLNVFPEYAHLRPQLVAACRAQFIALTESLRQVVLETPALRINAGSASAIADVPAEIRRRVHMGCGFEVRRGWLNIDYAPDRPGGYDSKTSFLNYDLRRGLPPLEPGSVDLMFSSHFFEHLRHEEAVALLRSCRAALRPGGTIRFELPNFARNFQAYAERDAAFLDKAVNTYQALANRPEWARSYADLISRAVYEVDYSHKYIWDAENMPKLLATLGFHNAGEDGYREGLDSPAAVRREFSFYIEATG
jgi:SAM-dependent methyltransferase